MAEEKTTIEDLAVMVNEGFEEAGKRIDGLENEMNKRFDLVEGRLDAIDVELIDIKKKLENIVYRHEFELLKDRIETIEQRVGIKK